MWSLIPPAHAVEQDRFAAWIKEFDVSPNTGLMYVWICVAQRGTEPAKREFNSFQATAVVSQSENIGLSFREQLSGHGICWEATFPMEPRNLPVDLYIVAEDLQGTVHIRLINEIAE